VCPYIHTKIVTFLYNIPSHDLFKYFRYIYRRYQHRNCRGGYRDERNKRISKKQKFPPSLSRFDSYLKKKKVKEISKANKRAEIRRFRIVMLNTNNAYLHMIMHGSYGYFIHDKREAIIYGFNTKIVKIEKNYNYRDRNASLVKKFNHAAHQRPQQFHCRFMARSRKKY